MRTQRVWVALIAICALLLSAVSAQAASLKIGYFDLQAVLDQSQWGKEAKAEFAAKKAALQSQVRDKAKEFEDSKQAFEKQQALLDDKAKKEKILELRQMQMEGEKLLMQTNAELNKLSQDLTKPIIDKVIEIVQSMGKKEKYDYIFEVQKGGLVYATEKTDLTKDIIKELDKAKPKK
ncbi:MAG: OmpH family outer membrane protein [Desulfacinum sp.]|jgi:outer membrane protein|nr:OmpH family outer membrane protein [Desulfacinum sp.]